jgi:aldehyde:ferredoxin oxidoreductase
MRAFNAREGAGRDQDILPKRLFDEPLKGGRSDGVFVPRDEFEQSLDMYYSMAGWDQATGVPMQAKLEDVVDR